MKSLKFCFLLNLAILSLVFSCTSYSASQWDSFASIKSRYENRHSYDFQDAKQSFWLTNIRVGAELKLNDSNSFLFELQDARLIGEDPNGFPRINPDSPYQVFEDPLDIHRFYWKYNRGNYSIKAGRQKLNLGDKRLVASLEWVNTARVHDGLRITHATENRTIDAFATNVVGNDPNEFNGQRGENNRYQDAGFHGIFVQETGLSKLFKVDYWYLLRRNGEGIFDDNVHTYGARFWNKTKHYQWDIQGAWQTGDFFDTRRQQTLDHQAHMFYAGIKYFQTSFTLAANYSFGSGDDDPSDGKHETFDNLYPLNHPYYGLMDLVSLQNIHNWELAVIKPNIITEGDKFRFAFHTFELDTANDAWYNAGLAPNIARLNSALGQPNVDTNLSNEIDITYSFKLFSTNVLVGISRWYSKGYLKDTGNSDNANFFYAQFVRSF